MVNATNAGGEAQSIADFAVFEPTPDTMVEVHKTIVYENVHDKNIVQVSKREHRMAINLIFSDISSYFQILSNFSKNSIIFSEFLLN